MTLHRKLGLTAAGLVIIACFLPDGRANLPKEVGRRTMPAVAFVLAADIVDGKLTPIASGSGTILTPDGAVLTNHHVIADEKTGKLRDAAAIGLLKAYDQAPELTCIAIPKKGLYSAEMDLALLKCEMDLQGKPYRASAWPTIPVGASAELLPGSSEIFIMGYPGIGGSTIHVTRGTVSGFVGDDMRSAGRHWIKTDAAIAHGNSGGTAIDDEGNLVGIPTAVKFSKEAERVGMVRPVELAKPFTDKALRGWMPSEEGGAEAPTPPPKNEGPKGGGVKCPSDMGVAVSGGVFSSENEEPIESAFVVVLRPGVKRKQVAADYSNLDSLFYTFGVTAQDGRYTLSCPLPRDKKFTVIVKAKGYLELSKDDVLSTEGVPDLFEPWDGKILLQRE
jgi:S1-C subfamily serine protease